MLNSRLSLRNRASGDITQVRFGKDGTFGSVNVEMPSRMLPSLSIKSKSGGLTLSRPGAAYELSSLSNAEVSSFSTIMAVRNLYNVNLQKSPTSPTVLESPSSKFTADTAADSYDQAHQLPSFRRDHERDETESNTSAV